MCFAGIRWDSQTIQISNFVDNAMFYNISKLSNSDISAKFDHKLTIWLCSNVDNVRDNF